MTNSRQQRGSWRSASMCDPRWASGESRRAYALCALEVAPAGPSAPLNTPLVAVGFRKFRMCADLGVRYVKRSSSGGVSVLVDEAAEDVVALDPLGGEGDDVWVVSGSAKLQGPVGPCGVVVLGVLGEDVPQVLLVVDQ